MAAQTHRPLERRPIASRERKSARLLAAWLARHGVSPNAISIAGLLCGLAAGAALAGTSLLPAWERALWLLASVLVVSRLTANMLDGMVAVESGRASRIGELYNEIPDRLSDAAILIGAGYARGGDAILGFLAALAAVFTAYVRAAGKVAGAAQEYCGPMAKQERMFTVTLVSLYSGLAPESWKPVLGSAPGWGLPALALAVIFLGSILTALRRLRRIAHALRKTPT